jgi:hypothetical protein
LGNVLPQFGAAGFTSAITAWTPQGWSFYDGLALQLTRRFTRGLQTTASYTWSHLIDNSTTEFGATYLTPRRGHNFQNLSADKASSLLDRRQRFSHRRLRCALVQEQRELVHTQPSGQLGNRSDLHL